MTGKPEEALRLMELEKPHVVLPRADGIDLMGDMLTIANVPVIFLSGYGQDHVIVRSFQMGAEDYIVKPFSQTELVTRIPGGSEAQGGAGAGGALRAGESGHRLRPPAGTLGWAASASDGH